MPKKKHDEFIEADLVGDTLIEQTILGATLPESEPIEEFRDHPERELPGKGRGRRSQAGRPPRNDPRHTDQSVLPGRDDLPAGTERRMPPGSS